MTMIVVSVYRASKTPLWLITSETTVAERSVYRAEQQARAVTRSATELSPQCWELLDLPSLLPLFC